MKNETSSEAGNETADETINSSITQMSHHCANMSIDVSLYDVASILQYLSQCDLAQGESGNELESELCFGRSYLMGMLGDCVHHFHENAENMEHATDKLNQIITSNKEGADRKIDTLVELHGFYKTLIEYSENDSEIDLNTLKMAIRGHENKLSLTISDALVDFKRVKTVAAVESAAAVQ